MKTPPTYDVAIVGAGIVGLAHAMAAARRGLRTAVLERQRAATGASIRNFGFFWPIGQPAGEVLTTAMRSREVWLEVVKDAGLWHRPVGSLHLARNELEFQVLQEFAAQAATLGYPASLLEPSAAAALNRHLRMEPLLGALHSHAEIQVSPREVLAQLPNLLRERHQVTFHFDTLVSGIESDRVQTSRGEFRAKRVYVCSGEDFQTLYPEHFKKSGVSKCKLQMLRVDAGLAPDTFGVCVAGGLSLRYYASFRAAASLPLLAAKVAEETPLYDRWGIHVLAGQSPDGSLVVGDSHEYGEVDPFNKEEIDNLILEYLQGMLSLPRCRVLQRWSGVYARHPSQWKVQLDPAPGVTIVNALSGSGMTLAFGVAEANLA